MSLLDMYRNNVQRKREEISRLSQDKAKEMKKSAELSSKIASAKKMLSSTKSLSTIKSKTSEIIRYQDDIAKVEKKIADLELKISSKEKELIAEQKKVDNEEKKEDKKRQEELEKRNRINDNQLININRTLNKHSNLHYETRTAIEDLKKNLPEKIIVLFFASNPIDQPQLRLDEEARAITEMIRKSKHRDSIKLESCWAVQPMDILQAINEHNPSIIHFSGHGSDQDEIVFQNSFGKAKLVSKDAIVQTMMASSENIRLVFFNTCFSYNQAEAVTNHVEAAIGMNMSIGDEAARIFASQFYSAIGFGLSVKKAFDQARALLMMEGIPEENTPQLYIRIGINPDEMFLVKVDTAIING